MKKEKAVPKSFFPRRSRRVSLKIKFKVSGRDVNGNQFEDLVETCDLGSHGGCFPFKHEVRVGSTLKLTGPKGFVSLVRVVWVDADSRTRARMLGFQLLEPREDWVLPSPGKPFAPPASKRKA